MKLSKIDKKGNAISVPEDMGIIVRRLGISAPPVVSETLSYLKSIGYVEIEHSVIPAPPPELLGKCRVELDIPSKNTDGTYTRTYKFVELTVEEIQLLANKNRAKRDKALQTLVDPINAVRWAAMTPEKQVEWIAYRDALLNISTQAGWPSNVVWPEIPTV